VTAAVTVDDVSRATPARCMPAVDVPDVTSPDGRCQLEEATQDVELSVLTAFGEVHLATCSIYRNVAVAGDGTVASSSFTVVGGRGCDSVTTCRGGRYGFTPVRMPGRLYLDGAGRVHRVLDVCFDSALGRFRGRVDVTLHREGGEWWSRNRSMPVGLTGWTLTGDWRLKRNINDRRRLHDKAVHLSVRPAN
jgi:hypothetical protein